MLKSCLPDIIKPTKNELRVAQVFIVGMALLIGLSILLGVQWGDGLSITFSGFASGVILNVFGISPLKSAKNGFWLIIISVPLYWLTKALIALLKQLMA